MLAILLSKVNLAMIRDAVNGMTLAKIFPVAPPCT